MPYKIVEVSRGKYKVKKNRQGRPVYMSKKGISLTMAKRQLRALYMHGGDMEEDKPTVDSEGLKEIPVEEFAAYQQYLINATPQVMRFHLCKELNFESKKLYPLNYLLLHVQYLYFYPFVFNQLAVKVIAFLKL